MICDETYAGIPKAVRAELHERFARWLESQAPGQDGFGEHDEILGYHLEQAYRCRTELVPADGPAQALAAEAAGLLALAAAGRRALGNEDVPAAVGLFERALALMGDDDRIRSGLLTDLGSAAIRSGEWERARGLLDGAISSAKRVGDRRSELRATIELQWQRSYTEPSGAAEEDRRVAEALIPELEHLEDHLGLAKAWWLLSESHGIASRWEARADASRGRSSTHSSPRTKGQLRLLVVLYAQALYYGPTPVPVAVRRCSDLLADAPGAPTFEAGLGTWLAGLRAMEGHFTEARALYADSVAVYQEFGLRFRRAVRSIVGAQIESLAGDLAAAERELRTGYSMLEEMGESGAAVGGGGLPRRRPVSTGTRRRGGAVCRDRERSRGRDGRHTASSLETRAGANERTTWRDDCSRGSSRGAPSTWPTRRTSSIFEQAPCSRSETCSEMRAGARTRRTAWRRLWRSTSSRETSRRCRP